MSGDLVILAGREALARIRSEGLRPEAVETVAGAAGGPKWLVLGGLDRVLFGQWLPRNPDPVFLIGSSIGAWRFAAVSQKDPAAALDRFEKAYIDQRYETKPTPEEVTRETLRIGRIMLGPDGPAEILNHPRHRLNILSVRAKGPAASDNRVLLTAGFLAAFALNLAARPLLGLMFERTLFSDPRQRPPFYDLKGFPLNQAALTEQNLASALLASGSIPLVMSGVRDIPEAPRGVHRDGGVLDYHLDLPFNAARGLVLFPHFSERLVPGWLDKSLSRRGPDPERMKDVVLVCPSSDFIAGLPDGKIPDRNDFRTYIGRDGERIKAWRRVVERCARLGDEFLDLVETNRIRERVRPLFPET